MFLRQFQLIVQCHREPRCKCFAAAVSDCSRAWDQSQPGAGGHNSRLLASLEHLFKQHFRCIDASQGVQANLCLHLLVCLVYEESRGNSTNVEEQSGYIYIFESVSNFCLVLMNPSHLLKVCYDVHNFDIGIFLLKGFKLFFHLEFVPRDHADVESRCRHVIAYCIPDTITTAGDYHVWVFASDCIPFIKVLLTSKQVSIHETNTS
jgi:hypothetical protein